MNAGLYPAFQARALGERQIHSFWIFSPHARNAALRNVACGAGIKPPHILHTHADEAIESNRFVHQREQEELRAETEHISKQGALFERTRKPDEFLAAC